MSHHCIITIDNQHNSHGLELIEILESSGRISQEDPKSIQVRVGALVPAGGKFSFQIESDILFAAGIQMVWHTGHVDQDSGAIVEMTVQNALLGNEVDLAVDSQLGAAHGKKTYGVSYFLATQGDEPTLSRDYINTTGDGHTPLRVVFKVVENELAATASTSLPMNEITNVVMLMLENRGFDHLLGQLYQVDPSNIYPAGSKPPAANSTIPNPINFDGLHNNPTFSNMLHGKSHTISPVSGTLDIPTVDPGEIWRDTNQQLFGTTHPGPDAVATMEGFVANYHAQPTVTDSSEILQYYTPESLPVMNSLAANYAVSDAWFCSVPSQTTPNRAFSLQGTSEGYVDNYKDPGVPSGKIKFLEELVLYKSNTIFNVLSNCGMEDWAIYYQDSLLGMSLTETLFRQVTPYKHTEHIQPFDKFVDTILNHKTLPKFTYLEPSWNTSVITGTVANDYHPPYNVCPGEQNLASVYNLLTKYKHWETTLFIVTFDEHGGTFDHVPPPKTIAPDPLQDWSKFGFDRLGLRIPTILISPRIQKGTVFRSPDPNIPFDHTSFLSTILAWQGIDISKGTLGHRAARAPQFSGVLSNSVVNAEAVILDPPVCPVSAFDRFLNDLQRFLFPNLALRLCGEAAGSRKHNEMIEKLHSLKTEKELHDFVQSHR